MQATHWDQIENPVTGERLRFLRRDVAADSVTMEVTFPAGGRPVVKHRHPGWENFEVTTGVLDLTVNDLVHRIRPGEQFTVTNEYHFPANSGPHDAVVVVTASPGGFAERGIRVALGLAAENGYSERATAGSSRVGISQ